MLIKFQFVLSIEERVHFDRENSCQVGTCPNLWCGETDQLLTKSIEPENIWFLFLNVLESDSMKCRID